jgi:hypothetical protein
MIISAPAISSLFAGAKDQNKGEDEFSMNRGLILPIIVGVQAKTAEYPHGV